MKHLLALVLVATALAVSPTAAATAAPEQPRAAARSVTLDGVTVRVRKRNRQVVTVNHTKSWHARVTYWVKRRGRWHEKFQATDGRIGYGGLVRARKRVQGSGKTPLGTFRMPWAFGMHNQKSTWDKSYRKARKGDYWVLDNQSDHYNRYRKKSQGGFRWWLGPGDPNASERLRDYPQQYEFSFVTSFNHKQVKHRGGAIFLHVNGNGATAGCASAPRWFLRKLMYRVRRDQSPLVAIGR